MTFKEIDTYQIAEKFGGEIVKVDFEFQKNGGYMLRIKR